MKFFGTKESYKWEVLLLLWIAFFLNQADRQAFNVVIPLIKADLGLSDTQIGFIATSFNIVLAIFVPLAGYVGDLYSRKWIIVLSILFWSIATMFTGLSNGVLALIITRSIAMGGGEAFFAPSNYALLAGYHKKTRALAMSVHQTSYYVGIILSGFLAGYIGDMYGWRAVFYIFGGFGVIYGILLIFRLIDKHEQEKNKERIKFSEAVKVLLKTPTAVALIIAYSGMIFVQVGYLTWAPTYLYEKFNMGLAQAGFHSMVYAMVFSFIGIIIAGLYSDRAAKKYPKVRVLMQAVGLLCAMPFIMLMGNSEKLALVYIGFAGFGFARSFFDANTYTTLYDVVPVKYQSTATGILALSGFLVGSLSPLLMGFLKSMFGLSLIISSLSAVYMLCGAVLLIAYKRYFRKDYEAIHNGNEL